MGIMRCFGPGIACLTLLFLLVGCVPQQTATGTAEADRLQAQSLLAPMSDAEFAALSAEEQYRILNNLLATLYKGETVESFFAHNADWSSYSPRDPEALRRLYATLTGNGGALRVATLADATGMTFRFSAAENPVERIQAELYQAPLDHDYFIRWMAYTLANTRLFSPAIALRTTRPEDAERVYRRLVDMIGAGYGIREIVYAHMVSQENWRRFRSPEDNVREMMEIFLGWYRDEDVPVAAGLCRNWSLVWRRGSAWTLVVDDRRAPEPGTLFGRPLSDCYGFYDALSRHERLIPTIAAVLVEQFFPQSDPAVREKLVQELVASDPQRFEDIFLPLLFSRTYLRDNRRYYWAEERFHNLMRRIGWRPDEAFFIRMNSAHSPYGLGQVGQLAMSYKLGRTRLDPDMLEFMAWHRMLREYLLLDRKHSAAANDFGWVDDLVAGFDDDAALMRYLFLAVLARRPSQQEIDTLLPLLEEKWSAPAKALVLFDYFSRLTELYVMDSGLEAGT